MTLVAAGPNYLIGGQTSGRLMCFYHENNCWVYIEVAQAVNTEEYTFSGLLDMDVSGGLAAVLVEVSPALRDSSSSGEVDSVKEDLKMAAEESTSDSECSSSSEVEFNTKPKATETPPADAEDTPSPMSSRAGFASSTSFDAAVASSTRRTTSAASTAGHSRTRASQMRAPVESTAGRTRTRTSKAPASVEKQKRAAPSEAASSRKLSKKEKLANIKAAHKTQNKKK